MDLSARFAFEERHRQEAEFLKKELETCLRSAKPASVVMDQSGNRGSAKWRLVHDEHGYATILRSLSVPQYSKKLTIKSLCECTKQMKVLRKMLDGERHNKLSR